MDFSHVIERVWRDEHIGDAELDTLLRWLLTNDGRRQFEGRIARDWAEFGKSDGAGDCVFDYESTLRKIHARKNAMKRDRRRSLMRRGRWIASAVAAVAAGFFIANHGDRFATQGNDAQIAAANKAKATLTLADGKVIVIDDYCGAFVEEQGRAIKIGQGNLEYTTDGESGQPSGETQSVFHEISIPVGSDYRITLSDGSVVWLNSGTRLRYPMTFPSGERRLALAAGEAYFEVEADAARPFVVESRWQSVTVLGTSFNLSAYPDDGNVVTTLGEGSVRIEAADGRQVTLEPGQQARLDMASGRVSLQRVDAWQVAEWRNGYIVIEDLTLEQVMERISRWSGMEYRIAADVPRDIVFRGILRKYDLATTLEKFGMISNLKVELDGNIVTVRQ